MSNTIMSVVQAVLDSMHANYWNPSAYAKTHSGQYVSIPASYINADQIINWSSFDPNFAVNNPLSLSGTETQNGLIPLNNHDPQTCLLHLHAIALYKQLNPTDTRYDSDNTLGYLGLATSSHTSLVDHIINDFYPNPGGTGNNPQGYGGYSNPKGWIYFALLEIYLALQNSPLLSSAQVQGLKNAMLNAAWTYYNSWYFSYPIICTLVSGVSSGATSLTVTAQNGYFLPCAPAFGTLTITDAVGGNETLSYTAINTTTGVVTLHTPGTTTSHSAGITVTFTGGNIGNNTPSKALTATLASSYSAGTRSLTITGSSLGNAPNTGVLTITDSTNGNETLTYYNYNSSTGTLSLVGTGTQFSHASAIPVSFAANQNGWTYSPSQSLLGAAALRDAASRFSSSIFTGMFYSSTSAPQSAALWTAAADSVIASVLAASVDSSISARPPASSTLSYTNLFYTTMISQQGHMLDGIQTGTGQYQGKIETAAEASEALVRLYALVSSVNTTVAQMYLTQAQATMRFCKASLWNPVNTLGGFLFAWDMIAGTAINNAAHGGYMETRSTGLMLRAYHNANLAVSPPPFLVEEQATVNALKDGFYQTSTTNAGFFYRTALSFGIYYNNYNANYSSYLTAPVHIGDTTVTVNDKTGLPLNATYALILEGGTANEEDVTVVIGTKVIGSTGAFVLTLNGGATFAKAHPTGAAILSPSIPDYNQSLSVACTGSVDTSVQLPTTTGMSNAGAKSTSIVNITFIIDAHTASEEEATFAVPALSTWTPNGSGYYVLPLNALSNGGTGKMAKSHSAGATFTSIVNKNNENQPTSEADGHITSDLLLTLAYSLPVIGASASGKDGVYLKQADDGKSTVGMRDGKTRWKTDGVSLRKGDGQGS